MNKVILLGRVGTDIKLKYTPGGLAVCDFRFVTNEKKTVDGEKKEFVEWHNIVVFSKTAETVAKYCVKGSQLVLEGKIKYDTFEKDGSKIYKTSIICDSIHFCGGGNKRDNEKLDESPIPVADKKIEKRNDVDVYFMEDGDIPF